MTWETTSKRRGDPFKIGDDVCWVLKKTKLKNPPPNKRFPAGITVKHYTCSLFELLRYFKGNEPS